MPIYEYRCEVCEHMFEKLVRAASPKVRCPECEGVNLSKRISLGGFILKGDGWFKDGYSKGG
jgi:putative FmdB family regulatory protein